MGPAGEEAQQRQCHGAGKGTAPVGGTTGAVDAPSPGGERPVRRSLQPLRGASGSIMCHGAPRLQARDRFRPQLPLDRVIPLFGNDYATRCTRHKTPKIGNPKHVGAVTHASARDQLGSRPARTASATALPSSAAATRAAQQCSSHSRTPSREPEVYAESAPT